MRDIAPLAIGYACHLTMVSLLGWNGMLLVAPSGAQTALALSSTDMVQAVVYPLAFLLVGALAARSSTCRPSKVLLALTALMAACGGLLFLSFGFWYEHVALLAMVAGALIGGSTAAFFMFWQLTFAKLAYGKVAAVLAAGTFLAGLAFFLVMATGSNVVADGLFVVCLATSTACLWRGLFGSLPQLREQESVDESAEARVPAREALRDLWQPALCIAALGFASGVAPLSFFSADTAVVFNGLKAVARVASAVAFGLLWWRLFRRNDRYALFYLVTFPVIATGFLLLPFLGFEYQLAFSVVAYLIFSMASMVMMLLCVQESRERGLNPLAVYGLFAGFVYVFNRLGKVFGSSQGYGMEFGFSQLLVMALFVVYGLSIIVLSTRFRGTGLGVGRRAADQTEGASAGMASAAVSGAELTDAVGAACDRLAEAAELTPREAEVLAYLARGRNVTFISDKLVVSGNTVQAHIKGIYRKLDVHSR